METPLDLPLLYKIHLTICTTPYTYCYLGYELIVSSSDCYSFVPMHPAYIIPRPLPHYITTTALLHLGDYYTQLTHSYSIHMRANTCTESNMRTKSFHVHYTYMWI